MTNDEIIDILNQQKQYYIEADAEADIEAIEGAISAVKKIKSIERLVNMYAQKGHAPTRTITMEELKRFIS